MSEAAATADVPFNAVVEQDTSDSNWITLLASARKAIEEGVEIRVDPAKVRRMPDQPRTYFSSDSIARLSVSMKGIGQIVPGIIRRVESSNDDGIEYEILDGERRWRSAIIAGISYRALVVRVDNASVPFIIAAVANFNREGHTPTEVSDSIEHMRRLGIPMEEVAKILGISLNWATQMHILQRLTPEVRDMLDPNQVKSKILPVTSAIQIAKADQSLQLSLAKMVMERKMSIAEVRAKALKLSVEAGTYIRTRNEPRKIWRSIENQTSQALRSLNEIERLLNDDGSDTLIRGRDTHEINRLLESMRTIRSLGVSVQKIVQDARA